MNYGQVMSAKLNNDGQSQLEKSPSELKMLMDACGRQVGFLKDILFFHYEILLQYSLMKNN